ncbi:MAG: hypothetical protein AWM53_00761 [Candidatus Dichloromethanomonas elyunquensis]|nr:MAG: hypothetical protein AWM53_00761 [Candidatus Dichloromethanomonas elyunquensis]
MDPIPTSYLLQRVAPLVMRELGPRVGPIFAEKVGIPLAKKVGLPIAKRIGIPIARRTGMLLFNKVGYPFINKMLFKLNLDTPQDQPATVKPAAETKKNMFDLKNLFGFKKNGRKTKTLNNPAPNSPAPGLTPVLPAQPNQLNPLLPTPIVPQPVQERAGQNTNSDIYGSTLFNRRRHNYGHFSE